MDSPISWGILLILTILAAYWFLKKIEEEKSQRKEEEENFWRKQFFCFLPIFRFRRYPSKCEGCNFRKLVVIYNRQGERLTIREEGYGGAEITDEVLTIFSLDYLRYFGAGLLPLWQSRHFSKRNQTYNV